MAAASFGELLIWLTFSGRSESKSMSPSSVLPASRAKRCKAFARTPSLSFAPAPVAPMNGVSVARAIATA